MEYYLKSTKFSIGNSYYLQSDKELVGNITKLFEHAYEVKFLTGYNIYTLYLFPFGNRSLMCAEIGLTPIMYEIIPKYQYYSEYLKYAEKPWPKFIRSYKRGLEGDFELPSLYPIYDVKSNNGTLCWALTQVVEWDLKVQPNLNDIHDFLSYARELKDEMNKNDVSKLDKIKVVLSEVGKGVVDGIKIYKRLNNIFDIELCDDTE